MKTNGALLEELLHKAIRDGEVPYQANREAVKAFDIFHDQDEGRQHLIVMLEGLDIFIADLEALGHAIEVVQR